MTITIPSLTKKVKWTLGATSVVIIALLAGYSYVTLDRGPIPAELRKDLTFSPFVLTESSRNIKASSYKFDLAEGRVQVLSYILLRADGVTITLSQYTQPPEFTEIPEYKDRFLTNAAKQYGTVQTSNGTIYLGRLIKQDNKQLAVMIERGLLLFMAPSKDLSDAEWRNIGDQLEVQKVIN
jgi:hypothetical protein